MLNFSLWEWKHNEMKHSGGELYHGRSGPSVSEYWLQMDFLVYMFVDSMYN